jgi:3-deoxy-D-manno-octulosonic-acid transferase
MRMRELGIGVILTTGTVTSANFARERLGEDLLHQYVPLDIKPAVSRFLNHWQPDLAIFAESEIWPMTILELGARRIPAGAHQRPHVGSFVPRLGKAHCAC